MKKFLFSLVFALFVLFPIVVWAISVPPGMNWQLALYGAGQLSALVGFVLIFFQYILSARIRWVERGIGLDRLFVRHRALGVAGLILVVVHPVTLTVFDVSQGAGLMIYPLKAAGVFAFVLVVVAAVFALFHVRLRVKYETWKNIHRIGYAIFPIAFVHSLFLGSTVRLTPLRVFWVFLAVLYAAAFVYRVVRWLLVRRSPHAVTDVVRETHDTWSVFFEKKNISHNPGQFMIVRLERDGKVSEPHPFTVSSSPTQDRLSITVKSVGDFTSTIGTTKTKDRALIDAPFGVFSFLTHGDSRPLVFVAGGIGITPFMSMLRYMRDKKIDRNVTLIWGNKAEKDLAFKEELESIQSGMRSLKVVHVMSAQEGWAGEKGYVDGEMLAKHVEDIGGSRFFLCGPPVMMKKIEIALLALGAPRRRIHYERFAL
jgi:predicted ferric reductase